MYNRYACQTWRLINHANILLPCLSATFKGLCDPAAGMCAVSVFATLYILMMAMQLLFFRIKATFLIYYVVALFLHLRHEMAMVEVLLPLPKSWCLYETHVLDMQYYLWFVESIIITPLLCMCAQVIYVRYVVMVRINLPKCGWHRPLSMLASR